MATSYSNRVFPWILTLGALSSFAIACGTSKDSNFDSKTQDPNATTGGSTTGSTDPSNPSPDIGTIGGSTVGNTGDGGLGGDGASCATSNAAATQKPVDLVFMIDTSGSMNNYAGSADPTKKVTKWEAVRTALETFLADKKSEGLGLSVQYFPLNRSSKGVDVACTANSECGNVNGDFCFTGLCSKNYDRVCTPGATCGGGNGTCLRGGFCRTSNDACTADADCPGDDNGCVIAKAGYCYGGATCSVDDYSKPVVPYAVLPGGATAAIASLDGREAKQGTPTVPALTGAHKVAAALAAKNTGRRTAVVLVTDGLPTGCTDNDIPNAAAVAKAGFEGAAEVPTYVLGVFAPAEAADATKNLNTIAKAGGSAAATIVKTDEDVAGKFLEALGTIRNGLLGCDFDLPSSTRSDPSKVSVKVTAGGTASLPERVSTEAACGKDAAWHFDVDPKTGATPTKVQLCPATCAAVKADPQAKVDIVVGCQDTVIIR